MTYVLCLLAQVKACKAQQGSCSCHDSVGVVAGDDGGAAGPDAQEQRALSARDVFAWPAEIPFTRQPQLIGKGAPVVAVIKSYGALLRFDPHTTPGTRVEVVAADAPEAQQVKVRHNCKRCAAVFTNHQRCCVRKNRRTQQSLVS
jgi:hypothetical protein